MIDSLKQLYYQCKYPEIIQAVSASDSAERVLLRLQAEKEMQIKSNLEIGKVVALSKSRKFSTEYFKARYHYLNDDYENSKIHFIEAQRNSRDIEEKTRAELGLVASLSSQGKDEEATLAFLALPATSNQSDLEISLVLMNYNLQIKNKNLREDYESEIYRCFSLASKNNWLFFQQRLLFCLIQCLIEDRKKMEAKTLFPILQSMIDPDISSYFCFLVNSIYTETGLESVTPISINKASQSLKFGDREISFQGSELPYRLLCLLAEAPGGIQKLEIIGKLWSSEVYDPFVHDNRLYNLINRVRKMIEKEPEQPFLLISSREGYKLTCSQ